MAIVPHKIIQIHTLILFCGTNIISQSIFGFSPHSVYLLIIMTHKKLTCLIHVVHPIHHDSIDSQIHTIDTKGVIYSQSHHESLIFMLFEKNYFKCES